MTNIEKIKELISESGNCVNLGRMMESRYFELHTWVLEETKFLNAKGKVKFNERVYCLINNITSIPYNYNGKQAIFVNLFEGYSIIRVPVIKSTKAPFIRPPKKTKLELFLKRNSKHNKALYLDSTVDGYDYVVCPVSGARLTMITVAYIKNTLDMTVEEYDEKYPGLRGATPARKDRIKQGVNAIDEETGLTKHQLSVEKSKATLNQVDNNGLRGYDRKGQKTRNSHMNNIDEYGRNGYSRLATKAIIKGNQTKVDKGIITPHSDKKEYFRYKKVVFYLTEQHREEVTKGYNTGLAGTDGAYQMDHIFSVKDGFRFKISPKLIGSRENLRMISWFDNVSKNSKSDFTVDQLLEITGYTKEESDNEFIKIMNIIYKDIENEVPPNGGYVLERLNESNIS